MADSKDFLMRGPQDTPPASFSLTGIKFLSLTGGIEIIGEITQVFDQLLHVKDPVVVGRDVRQVARFNLVKLHKVNPIVDDTIQIPISAVAFLCAPNSSFLKNYLAARSGLVSPPMASFDEDETTM